MYNLHNSDLVRLPSIKAKSREGASKMVRHEMGFNGPKLTLAVEKSPE